MDGDVTLFFYKIGVTHCFENSVFAPKPFRVRLLGWVPLFLGMYMFVWPLFYRIATSAVATTKPALAIYNNGLNYK